MVSVRLCLALNWRLECVCARARVYLRICKNVGLVNECVLRCITRSTLFTRTLDTKGPLAPVTQNPTTFTFKKKMMPVTYSEGGGDKCVLASVGM